MDEPHPKKGENRPERQQELQEEEGRGRPRSVACRGAPGKAWTTQDHSTGTLPHKGTRRKAEPAFLLMGPMVEMPLAEPVTQEDNMSDT